MFEELDEKSPTEPGDDDDNVDYSGLIIGASILPVFFLFVYLGKAAMGFAVSLDLGVIILAIKFNWHKRNHVWFWATIVLIFALHIPLFLIARVPDTKFPTLAISLPVAIADFFIVSGVLKLAEAVFTKGSSSPDEHEQ